MEAIAVLSLIVGIFSSILIGGIIIALGQVFLAIREIALNTRSEESQEHTNYGVLMTMAKVNNFFGWAIIIIGILMSLLTASGLSVFDSHSWY